MKIYNTPQGRTRSLQDAGSKSTVAEGGLENDNMTGGNDGNSLAKEYCRRLRRYQSRARQISMLCSLCLLGVPCAFSATFRWSPAANRIFVENGGSATLSDIKAALPLAPLDLVNSTGKVWLLRAELLVQNGCTLRLRGTSVGGDVNELRLQSISAATNCGCVASITADWGTLDIHSTKITSWDTMISGPDTNHLANGRAYIRVRSSLSTNGVTPLESRMDIANSEICHLGTDDTESYGLVWKVVGADPNPANSIFDKVNVYGSIVNSRIHHNYIGAYAFGAQNMQWLTNEVSYNVQSGLDSHDDSDNLLIQGNDVHHNGNHGIIASMRCDHLIIRGNLCSSNVESGIVLHRSSNTSLVEGNRCLDNGDSGIALTASYRNTVRNNQLWRNGQAGVRLDLGSADNLIASNECASNTLYGFYFYKGGAEPEPNDDGRPKRNQIVGNLIQRNGNDGIRIAESDDNIFATNTFSANGPKLRFQRGLRNRLDGNSIPVGVSARTEGDAGSSASTHVRNQGVVKVELGTNAVTIFEDAQGRICQPDEATILTAISSSGSSMTLTLAEIGNSSTVVARNFFATASPGSAQLNQLVWSPATRTQWSVAAAAVGQSLNFTVGDLAANTAYEVRKAGVVLTNLNSDSSGWLRISDTATATSPLVYSVGIPTTNQTGFRYSATLNRIYLEEGTVATLSDIKAALPAAPLELVSAPEKIWLLRADLMIQDGSTLALHGTGAGGDVDELRLLSLNTGETGSVVSVIADWGTLDIDSTRITSWDTAVNGPDTNPLAFGRAFLRARSSLSTNGVTPLESRMDIRDSELSHLGYDKSDSYGVVWKVGGSSTNGLFDEVNVHGDVSNSRFHDNYIGAYTVGAHGMQWLTNELYLNVQEGLDLQSDSDSLVLQGNSFHHNGSHGLLASARCDHLSITGNRSWANAGSGILLEENSDDAELISNQCFDNIDSGIVIDASARSEIRNNLLLRNEQAGLRLSAGSADNLIEANHSASNTLYGFHAFLGSAPESGDGRPKRNLFVANQVHDNGVDPLRLADGDDNTVATNTFTGTSGKLRFQRGLRNRLEGNNLPPTLIVRTEGSTNANASTYVRNQGVVKVELGTNATTIFEDPQGRIYQPDEDGTATLVNIGGSSLMLTETEIGSSATVTASSLRVATTEGSAVIVPFVGTNGNGSVRRWLTQADSLVQGITYTVGNLDPNRNYVVSKAGVALITTNSGPDSAITFADVAGTPNLVLYSVDSSAEPSRVLLERRGDGVFISWTSGKLERATTLSPPDWQEVPTTNGQLSILINPAAPMEFFRSSETSGGPQ